MPQLTEIEREIENVLAVAEELDADMEPTALEYLEELGLQEVEKVDAISFALRRRKAQIQWLAEEERRLRSRRQAMERRVKSFRHYLAGMLQRFGVRSLRGNVGSLSLRDTVSVEVRDLSVLPREYKAVVVEERPSKSGIKAALQDGIEVPGARLVQGVSVTVR